MPMDIARTEMIILTEDIEKMKDFYADKLGLEVTRYDGHVAAFANGISMHPRNERHTKAADTPNNVDIALWVGDMDAAAKELKDRGVSFTTEPFDEGPIFLGMITDPEGNDVLLLQRK